MVQKVHVFVQQARDFQFIDLFGDKAQVTNLSLREIGVALHAKVSWYHDAFCCERIESFNRCKLPPRALDDSRWLTNFLPSVSMSVRCFAIPPTSQC